VERLSDSRAIAERWGRHWLDVARYAGTTGADTNATRPEAWRYRDYGCGSLAQDKPFDQFIREKIAGDLPPANIDSERAGNLIATGFLAIGQKSLNGTDPRQFAVDLAVEQIDTVSLAFMATTISSARGNNLKFEPISQRDYASIAGIFLSTDTRYGTAGSVRERNASTFISPSTSPPHRIRRTSRAANSSRKSSASRKTASRRTPSSASAPPRFRASPCSSNPRPPSPATPRSTSCSVIRRINTGSSPRSIRI